MRFIYLNVDETNPPNPPDLGADESRRKVGMFKVLTLSRGLGTSNFLGLDLKILTMIKVSKIYSESDTKDRHFVVPSENLIRIPTLRDSFRPYPLSLRVTFFVILSTS